jgi:hypothetical protein
MMWGPYYAWQPGPWMGLWMLIPLALIVALLIATLWIITRLLGVRQGGREGQGSRSVARMTPKTSWAAATPAVR